jgi:hypothetical protein
MKEVCTLPAVDVLVETREIVTVIVVGEDCDHVVDTITEVIVEGRDDVHLFEEVEKVVLLETAKQGPPGPPGPTGVPFITLPADGAIGGHRVVRAVAGGRAGYVETTDAGQANSAIGITTNAAADGDDLYIQFAGQLTEPSWSWELGMPVFIGAAGIPTQTLPGTGFVEVIAVVVSPTSIVIQPKSPIVLE